MQRWQAWSFAVPRSATTTSSRAATPATARTSSPALQWAGVLDGTAELLLLCEDPDAPSGTFLHWLVAGIDPGATGVGEGETPPGGREWTNGFGEPGWGGPQPPVGDNAHRYFFRLYALDQPARLPDKPTVDDVHRAVDEVALASGTTVGTYQR